MSENINKERNPEIFSVFLQQFSESENQNNDVQIVTLKLKYKQNNTNSKNIIN